jgi:septum formation protein
LAPRPLFLLASTSPRRKALLESLGIPFEVVPNPWDEAPREGESAGTQVRRLAREKLLHYLELHSANQLPVLTADTLLSFRGRPLNKPADETEAWAFYRALAGRTHRVLTSFALADPSTGRIQQKTVSTTVQFVPWDEEIYRRYLARGEWRDAAGGYKIQEGGCVLVRRISGSWTNVVGLPIAEVYGMIRATLRVHPA